MHCGKIQYNMEEITNNNCSYYDNTDTNFKQACDLCEMNFSHDDLLELLKSGNIPQKQIAALMLDTVTGKEDAEILLNNLTGCDGKIREAVAFKINLLLNNNVSKSFFADIAADKLADATIDINANICRHAVDSAVLLKEQDNFSIQYTKKIIKFTNDALNELDKFIFRDKKYVINKQIFKLYWCLEALKEFHEFSEESELRNIVEKCATQKEYTIREKIAQIIIKTNKFEDIKQKLINDENYYVRQILHHPGFF